jgi:hypothetical protein
MNLSDIKVGNKPALNDSEYLWKFSEALMSVQYNC